MQNKAFTSVHHDEDPAALLVVLNNDERELIRLATLIGDIRGIKPAESSQVHLFTKLYALLTTSPEFLCHGGVNEKATLIALRVISEVMTASRNSPEVQASGCQAILALVAVAPTVWQHMVKGSLNTPEHVLEVFDEAKIAVFNIQLNHRGSYSLTSLADKTYCSLCGAGDVRVQEDLVFSYYDSISISRTFLILQHVREDMMHHPHSAHVQRKGCAIIMSISPETIRPVAGDKFPVCAMQGFYTFLGCLRKFHKGMSCDQSNLADDIRDARNHLWRICNEAKKKCAAKCDLFNISARGVTIKRPADTRKPKVNMFSSHVQQLNFANGMLVQLAAVSVVGIALLTKAGIHLVRHISRNQLH